MANARPVRSVRLRFPELLRRHDRLGRLAAAAAAVPMAAFVGAAGASAAAPGQLDAVPDVDVAAVGLAGSAELSLLATGDERYETGRLKGTAVLGVPSPGGYSAVDNLFLHRKKGSGGDFGNVDVMLGPDRGESLFPGDEPAIFDFATGLTFEVARLPYGGESGGDPITLVTDPFVLEPVAVAEEFPPVGQAYRLEDSVGVFQETGAGEYEQVGLLEAFDVTVK